MGSISSKDLYGSHKGLLYTWKDNFWNIQLLVVEGDIIHTFQMTLSRTHCVSRKGFQKLRDFFPLKQIGHYFVAPKPF